MDESDFLLIITEAAQISGNAALAVMFSNGAEVQFEKSYAQKIEAAAVSIIKIIEAAKADNGNEEDI